RVRAHVLDDWPAVLGPSAATAVLATSSGFGYRLRSAVSGQRSAVSGQRSRIAGMALLLCEFGLAAQRIGVESSTLHGPHGSSRRFAAALSWRRNRVAAGG